jgi:hypothetical protein
VKTIEYITILLLIVGSFYLELDVQSRSNNFHFSCELLSWVDVKVVEF